MISRRSTPSIWDKYVLPLLFMGMETSWIDAILVCLANTTMLGTSDPLIPLWSPFALMAGFYAISRYLYRHTADLASTSFPDPPKSSPLIKLPLITLAILVILVMIWLSHYATHIFLLDPSWLLNIPYTLLQSNSSSFQLVGIAAISLMLCMLGNLLAQSNLQPVHVFTMMRLGAWTMSLLGLVWAFLAITKMGQFNEPVAVLLIALFFCLSLVTHALARVVSVRRTHSALPPHENVRERLALQAVLILCLLFLGIASTTGNTLGHLLAPYHEAPPTPMPTLGSGAKVQASPITPVIDQEPTHPASNVNLPIFLSPTGVFILGIILLILLLAGTALLLIRLWKKWRKRQRTQRKEVHESMWSWQLFWQQFKALALTLLARLFPQRVSLKGSEATEEESRYETPAVQNIREIYRILLHHAALQGYPRERHETPHEFQQRLSQHVSSKEPQLTAITEAYVAARYSDIVPDEQEVTQIRTVWEVLQQKWRHESDNVVKSSDSAKIQKSE